MDTSRLALSSLGVSMGQRVSRPGARCRVGIPSQLGRVCRGEGYRQALINMRERRPGALYCGYAACSVSGGEADRSA